MKKNYLGILIALILVCFFSCKKDNNLNLKVGDYRMKREGFYTYNGDQYSVDFSSDLHFVFHLATDEEIKIQHTPPYSPDSYEIISLTRSGNTIYAGDGNIGLINLFIGDGTIVNDGKNNVIRGEILFQTTHCCDFSGPQPVEVYVWVDGTYEFYPL